jgi:GMP synthase PP-ATPase subunit
VQTDASFISYAILGIFILQIPYYEKKSAVALRAVNTIDFMTAESAEIPFEVLQTVMSRIINEVRGVNRVFYDLTSKPPGTIEFE